MDENKYSVVEVIRDYSSKDNLYTTELILDEDPGEEYKQILNQLGYKNIEVKA